MFKRPVRQIAVSDPAPSHNETCILSGSSVLRTYPEQKCAMRNFSPIICRGVGNKTKSEYYLHIKSMWSYCCPWDKGKASCRRKGFRKEDSYSCKWTLFRNWGPIILGTNMLGWGWLRQPHACLACMGPGFFLQLWGKGHMPIFWGSLLLHSLSMAKSTHSESDPPVLNKLGFGF